MFSSTILFLLFLSHAVESYTAKPYNERTPRPADPKLRPSYQGSNPISDLWSLHALRLTSQYIKRYVSSINCCCADKLQFYKRNIIGMTSDRQYMILNHICYLQTIIDYMQFPAGNILEDYTFTTRE